MFNRARLLIVMTSLGAAIVLWVWLSRQDEGRSAMKTVPVEGATATSRPAVSSKLAAPISGAAERRLDPATTPSDAMLTMEERVDRAARLVDDMQRAELDAIDAVAKDDEERELLLDNHERSRASVESLADEADERELEDVIGEELAARKRILGEERYIQYLKAFVAGLRAE